MSSVSGALSALPAACADCLFGVLSPRVRAAHQRPVRPAEPLDGSQSAAAALDDPDRAPRLDRRRLGPRQHRVPSSSSQHDVPPAQLVSAAAPPAHASAAACRLVPRCAVWRRTWVRRSRRSVEPGLRTSCSSRQLFDGRAAAKRLPVARRLDARSPCVVRCAAIRSLRRHASPSAAWLGLLPWPTASSAHATAIERRLPLARAAEHDGQPRAEHAERLPSARREHAVCRLCRAAKRLRRA